MFKPFQDVITKKNEVLLQKFQQKVATALASQPQKSPPSGNMGKIQVGSSGFLAKPGIPANPKRMSLGTSNSKKIILRITVSNQVFVCFLANPKQIIIAAFAAFFVFMFSREPETNDSRHFQIKIDSLKLLCYVWQGIPIDCF